MLIMWYRNLFIKITYMYSSLLKRRLQRVVLRITAAPRSRRREAAGSARGPDPDTGRAAGTRRRGTRGPGRDGDDGVGGGGAHREERLSPSPGQAMLPRGEARTGTPPGARISWRLPASGQAASDLCQSRGGGRGGGGGGGCFKKSCPQPEPSARIRAAPHSPPLRPTALLCAVPASPPAPGPAQHPAPLPCRPAPLP